MKNVKARAKSAADKNHEQITIDRRELGPKDVLIEIKFAGICHSDIHTGRGEWGDVTYPIVTGHEIAGVVQEVGSEVTDFKEGDHVGVGCMVDSCGKCENCLNNEEQFCLNGATMTYDSTDADGQPTHGGYSTHIVVTENFVLHIPDSIPLDKAAPLLCAGITTYSPLNHWKAGKDSKVAVIGLGGLGHMAVQIAHAMGAQVTVLSRTLDKKDDGLKLGADDYFATEDKETFKKLAGMFDLIINTVSAKLPLDDFLGLLKVGGAMVSVGAPGEPMEINVFSLLANRRSYAGSMIGGIKETQEMLDFCAEHNIAPLIETINADDIDKAWDRVVDSDVRYRFVIDAATI